MDRYEKLERLANSLSIVSKVANIYNEKTRANTRGNNITGRADMFREMIDAVSRHTASDTRGADFGRSIRKCSEFCNTYRNLKDHIKTVKNKRPGHEEYVRTLSIIKPVVDLKTRRIIEKFLKIYDILYS